MKKNERYVISEKDSQVTLTLCREKKKNVLNVSLLESLTSELSKLESKRLSALFIRSSSKVFSAGHDFSDLHCKSEQELKAVFDASSNLMMLLRSLPYPVVSYIEGPAIGAGAQLALSADIVIATEEAYFQTTGAVGGWFCFTPMVALLQSIGAPKRAFEMLFTGYRITAKQAYEWGMINRVVGNDNSESVLLELSDTLAKGSFENKKLGKQLFYELVSGTQGSMYGKASALMAETGALEDAQKRISRFVNREERSVG